MIYLNTEFNEKDIRIIEDMLLKALNKRFNNLFSTTCCYSNCKQSGYICIGWS